MSPNPHPTDDRFQTAAEVAEVFQNCLAHLQQPTTVPLPSSLPRPIDKRRLSARLPVWVTVAFAVGLVPAALVLQHSLSPAGMRDDKIGESARPIADEKKRGPAADAKAAMLLDEFREK